MKQYGFIAYVITIASLVAIISIWQKNEVGIGFAGGITTGAFGALQMKKEDQSE